MVQSLYDVVRVVLEETDAPIPARNVWNFDETGTKTSFVRAFLYGLKGARLNNAEKCGGGEHVTIGAIANLEGEFLDPVFLFTGAQSSKANLAAKMKQNGLHNPLVLMKKGKASMDDEFYWSGSVTS